MDEPSLLYQLIIRQLLDDGFSKAAAVVSQATMVMPGEPDDYPSHYLSTLVHLGMQYQATTASSPAGGPSTSGASSSSASSVSMYSSSSSSSAASSTASIDTGRCLDLDVEGGSYRAPPPAFTTRFVTTHKNAVRVAKFSPDGRYVATGSADTSIKLLDVERMKSQGVKSASGADEGGIAHPVVRTFYDHTQPINDLDFHPSADVLVSCSMDCTIKFYDFKDTLKRAFRIIPVRLCSFARSLVRLLACYQSHIADCWLGLITTSSLTNSTCDRFASIHRVTSFSPAPNTA